MVAQQATLEATPTSEHAPQPASTHSPLERRAWSIDAAFPWIALLLVTAYASQVWLNIGRTSVTYDEPVHMLAGYQYWECADFGINPENPPLVKLLAALPLRSKTLVTPGPPCGSAITPKVDEYTRGSEFLVRNGIDRVVIPARTAVSSFGLLLALLVLFGTWRMFGKQEALVALALLAFEPTLIAHGSLATTDMAISATFFASAFALYMFCQRQTPIRAVLLGLSIGAMLASKHSALPALVLLWVLIPVVAWISRRKLESSAPATKGAAAGSLFRQAFGLACATALGIAVLWAMYGFHFYALPHATGLTLPSSALPPGAPGMAGALDKIVGGMRALHIFPEAYAYGFTDVLYQNAHHDMFLFGRTYPHAQWFYFPLAFLIKTSLPLLALVCVGLATPELYRKHRLAMAFLLIPGLGYFGFSLASGLAIGIRQVLPSYPFLICVAAAGACAWARRFPKLWIPVIALLAFGAVDSARAFPNYIAFSNELWGGTNNTYKVLSDSNVDWGQTLEQVNSYIRRNGIRDCWIAANGTPDIATATLPCHLLPAPFQWMDHPAEDIPRSIDGTIFLSTEVLPVEFPNMYAAIAATKPAAIIGGAMLVYNGHFDLPRASEWVHTSNSTFFFQHGRVPEAIAEMRQAVAIDPSDPRSHFALGMYLAAAAQPDAARDEFSECIRLASLNPSEFGGLREIAERQLQQLH